jgi:hypothetical protein
VGIEKTVEVPVVAPVLVSLVSTVKLKVSMGPPSTVASPEIIKLVLSDE